MTKEFEYIIIGSGVAGATIAKLILENNRTRSILMLEAGPRVKSKDRRFWWDLAVKSIFDQDKPIYEYLPYSWTYDQKGEYSVNKVKNDQGEERDSWYFGDQRVIAWGGSTMHWGGWSLRFKPEDFEMFSRTKTGIDWPFGYEELEPYYCKAEEYLAVCGDSNEDWSTPNSKMWRSKPYPLPVYEWSAPETEMANAFEACGIKPGRMPLARFRKCMTTGTCKYCPFGARFSADQILDELVGDTRYSNLRISCNSPVIRILSKTKRRVQGVEYVDAIGGEVKTVYGERVLLCGGAFESPKLLKLSANKYWEKGIGNDYDLVGRYLVSHSQLKVRGVKQDNKERWFQEYDFPTLMSRSWDSEDYQKEGKVFLYKNRKLPNLDLAAKMIAGKTKREVEQILESSRQSEVQGFFEDKGRPENLVDLHGTRKTRLGLPMTKVHFERTPEAQKTAENWLDRMGKIIEAMGYTVDRAQVYDPGGHHASGTCRMSVDASKGVTAPDLRIHGTDNLFICSNAIFPTLSAVNPTLTLTALAIRLAEQLNGDRS